MSSQPFIPVSRPLLCGRELEYVSEALQTGWISSAGKYLKLFEDKFATFAGCREGVACCNGTRFSSVQISPRGKGGPGRNLSVVCTSVPGG